MSITGKELSKLLNISPAAISMALNNKPGVSTATKYRIIEAATKYGYDFTNVEQKQHNNNLYGTIQFIIYKKSGAIITDTPFFSQLSEGISEACQIQQYNLNISYIWNNDNIKATLNEFNNYNCSGIILLATEMSQHDLEPFLISKLPIIVLDSYYDTLDCNFVTINNHKGAFQATNYLIRRCNSQPGYLHSSYSIANFQARANGFFDAIKYNGLSTSRSIIHKLTPSIEGAYADMSELLTQKETLASCYFADNDLIACGAIKALKEHGYNIPKDISIIGFDNLPLCTYIDPTLTTLQVSVKHMGQTSISRLIQIINDKSTEILKIEVTPKLIIRNSVV